MPKPKWLKDKEANAKKLIVEPNHCGDCIYFGKFIKNIKYKNKEWVELRECDIHPNCFNTKYSICCDDYMSE